MLKILIADDHALMREGIQMVLDRFDKKYQLTNTTNYEEVLQQINETPDFDLILLDLNMPGYKHFSGLEQVLSGAEKTPVIVLSASENPADMQQSIDLGAKGFVPKSASNEVLVAALELVLSGGIYIPPQLFNYSRNNENATQNSAALQPAITRRQKEVLALIAQGESNKEIGRTLGLSEGTVRTHVNAIFKLLNVNNRTQAGVKARTLDLL
ncbi:hypothetical protein MNBD_GAMMA06-938 [hydrothermal vent metagenome]|uniref:Two-component transcriptional response regulator, LuxR family n=1 Tax=hydrothermal vent metagenome TaxID=652676 RepID=A0A3B0X5Y9_9ZZZZ